MNKSQDFIDTTDVDKSIEEFLEGLSGDELDRKLAFFLDSNYPYFSNYNKAMVENDIRGLIERYLELSDKDVGGREASKKKWKEQREIEQKLSEIFYQGKYNPHADVRSLTDETSSKISSVFGAK